VLNPNHRGAVAEAAIAYEATRLGLSVFKPIAEHGRTDLVLEIAGRLLKVQCKSASTNGEVVRIGLESHWQTATRKVRSLYLAGEIDLIAAHCPELGRSYLLPFDVVAGQGGVQLRLSKARNGQLAAVHWAPDYEFPGAVAQLGERLAGSEEVRGSSPLSSTPQADGQITVGAHDFREKLGHWMERAAAGAEILITRRGRPLARLGPPDPRPATTDTAAARGTATDPAAPPPGTARTSP
jgi:prevent-host-death family protein